MENFIFQSPTKMILEKGAETLAGQEARLLSDKVLLVHYGDPFIYESGIHSRVTDSLQKAGVTVCEQAGITPNPVLAPVRSGIGLCRKHGIGCVLAVGGGSVVDTAKAIAMGTLYEGDVWEPYEQKTSFTSALPVGVVMTLPATGSEASNGSVITNEKTGEKLDIMSDVIRPKFVLMNPELTYTLPAKQTAAGIVDMFSHVMERYFSTSVECELTDRMCEGVMKSILSNAAKVMRNPRDYGARADLMVTSLVAHNGLLGVGRNQDWACHAMGAQLSGEYGAVHGATLSVLLPVWAKYVFKGQISRFCQFAVRVFDADMDFYDQKRTAEEGIRKMEEFFASLAMPLTLPELGVKTDEAFEKMAKNATKLGSIGCMKSLGAEDARNIYRLALEKTR